MRIVNVQQTALKVTKVLLRHAIRNMDYGGLDAVPEGTPHQEQRSQPVEVFASMDRETMNKAVRQGYLPPGTWVSPVTPNGPTFIPEHAARNRGIINPSGLSLPTTAETLTELKRRLAKELYRVELDLQNGLRIAGKPCDCAGAKHNFGIEATAEELMSYESNPVYQEVISWYNRHLPEFEPAEIEKKPLDYYQKMVPDIRNFRKKIMGTDDVRAMTTGG